MSQVLYQLFQESRKNRTALFLPYICLGYPTYKSSLEIARAALRGGADGLEIGVPFSDPIADGPTLQKATQRSLECGTKFKDVFRLIHQLRSEGFKQPLLVMTYLNLIEQMGWSKFTINLIKAKGDGAIIPDLPLEIFHVYNKLLRQKNLSLIPFVAPTSSDDRIKMADSQMAPFLYYVSVTGVTGARKMLAPELFPALTSLRHKAKTPLVVGFGISNAAQAAQVGKIADGVIIASALVQLIDNTKSSLVGKSVEKFCRKVVKALGNKRKPEVAGQD